MKLKNVKVGQRVQVKDASKPITFVRSCASFGLSTGHYGTIISDTLSPAGNVKVQFDNHDGRLYTAGHEYLFIKADNLRKVK